MNIIQSFNGTMAYIEKTLEEGYDESEIARISGYSYPLFSRIFSILVGYPLTEYLRLRKLSRAAADLRLQAYRLQRIKPASFRKCGTVFLKKAPHEELAKLGNGKSFGVCSEVKDGKTFLKIRQPNKISILEAGKLVCGSAYVNN